MYIIDLSFFVHIWMITLIYNYLKNDFLKKLHNKVHQSHVHCAEDYGFWNQAKLRFFACVCPWASHLTSLILICKIQCRAANAGA